MRDEQRGKIRNREFASQLRDFSGLRFGKITPTDIDGFIDFNDKLFVFIETKHGSDELSTGQRLALERLCDSAEDSGRHAIVLVAVHFTQGDIPVGDLPVVKIRHKRQWRKPRKKVTVRQAIDRFLNWMNSPL